ncbi:integrase, catalytic region, zinc finger, CCHC-type containing protein [Tanacetum coccineum]
MIGNLKLLCNFVEKYLGTVRFDNDQFAPIIGYGDLVQGNTTINIVYYVEGLNHNLFSVSQFCDADLEVAFRKSTCFVRDLQGNDLLTGTRGSDLYIISRQETSSPTSIYFMAKASLIQPWLWHRRLSHLNFDTINLLSKKDFVNGLLKLKYAKDQLCSSCELGKAKRSSFKTKIVPSSKGWLNLLNMDLCGPMRIKSINGKKYIQSKGYKVYNKRTRLIVESIHINFDEIKELSKATDYDNFGPASQLQNTSDHNRLLYDEFFIKGNTSISKSYALSDNSQQQDTQPTTNVQPTTELITPSININAEENKTYQADNAHFEPYEFINPFCTPRWTKDHLLEQVRGNPSKPVQTRRQLVIDPEMGMFALTVSIAETINIKEAMADHAWIEAMQEELHQFDRLKEDGIDFEESFAPVAHLEAVWIFDAYVQAPRAWYDKLSNFLMSKGFTKGTPNPTLFTIRTSDSPIPKSKLNAVKPIELDDRKKEMEDGMNDESVRSRKEELAEWETKAEVLVEKPRSQPVGYYLKHEINEKLIEGIVDTHKYNDSLLATRLGIMEDLLIDIAGYVYPVDFVILHIEEDKNKPFIIGMPFLTTAMAEI